MQDEFFVRQLKVSLTSSERLDQVLLLIKLFRDQGGKQEVAEAALSGLLEEYLNEDTDALVRDCLDFVIGWCQPGHEIWPDQT